MRWTKVTRITTFLAVLAVALASLGGSAPDVLTMRSHEAAIERFAAALVVRPTLSVPTGPFDPAPCPPEPPLPARVLDLPPRTQLVALLRDTPERLGSASIGSPTRGRLFGGVELKSTEAIQTEGGNPWGTETAIRSIERAVRQVRRCYPDTPRLHVGDISRAGGGWLRPHRSHQSGLDADLGYYYLDGPAWYQFATAQNLDRPRTWALIRALVDGGTVEMIFIDRSVQELLKEHVAKVDPEGLALFQVKSKPREGVIRHAWGHATHLHVRFSDPASVALGGRIAPIVKRR